MKPSFALNISDSAIGLLHRTARGWMQVGETAFDTADLAEALGYLRGSALGLSPGGLTTKLVLPNSQIKYLELDAPGPNEADRRNQIRAALVGRTPYNVEDLVFDWCGAGPKVQVAVVPRETLDEAEAFAVEHRFNPVSFVGMPVVGDFKGEPWFGPTKLSVTVLEKGEKVDRDTDAIQVAARDLPKSHPGVAKAAPDLAAASDDPNAQPTAETDKPRRAQRRAAAAAAAEQALAEATAAAEDRALAEAPVDGAISDAFPESGDDLADTRYPAAEIHRAATADVAADAAAPEITAPIAVPAVATSQVFPEVSASGGITDEFLVPRDDVPPAPSPAIMAAFASRRASDMPNARRFGEGPIDSPVTRAGNYGETAPADRAFEKSTPPPLSRPKAGGEVPSANVVAQRIDAVADAAPSVLEAAAPKVTAAKPNTAFVTAPTIPGSRKRKSVGQGAVAQPRAADARKSLTKPGGTFASSKERGKPRYLGLILTGLLLLFLALIAAWSSVVVSSNDATQTGTAVVAAAPQPRAPVEQATAEIPAVADEMLADGQDTAAVATTIDGVSTAETAPAAGLTSDAQTDTMISTVDATAVTVPEPAPTVAAATDSPNASPLTEAQDEIFLTAIDAPPLSLDPLSLPQPAASTDALPLPQLEPPPFGTVYQFDADGRIRPTPEGIITPEGVRLVAGKPGLIPPARPEAVIAASLPVAAAAAPVSAITPLLPATAAATAAPFPSDPALANARPRLRPAGLAPAAAQANDGAAIASTTATRISGLRPLARPAAILAAGEAARQSTAAASLTAQAEQAAAVEAAVQASFQPDANTSPLAVSVSRKPAPRPKDMSRAVEAAVAAAVRAPEPQADAAQAAVEADSEPETVSAAPAIPTRASVAKQATYVNAINLSKINLIGVYGSKSNPYALIRQANGRYKKVKIGDSIDGGKVAAIGASELRYQKSGRMISLKLPKT